MKPHRYLEIGEMPLWTAERETELRLRWVAGEKRASILSGMGITQGQLNGRIRAFNLPKRSRGRHMVLPPHHPAAVEGRTLFPTSLRDADGAVLKFAGTHQKKLGGVVMKGKWRGFPIYSLTLEERATCPRTCEQWFSCYGNSLPFAVRYRPGRALEVRLNAELHLLQRKFPRGFVVRLHILGEFYSQDYIRHWNRWMDRYPALHVFGYTHHQQDTPRGGEINKIIARYEGRFMVRFSDAPDGFRSIVIPDEEACPPDAIICPVETGKTKTCSTCALCWSPHVKTIAFLAH